MTKYDREKLSHIESLVKKGILTKDCQTTLDGEFIETSYFDKNLFCIAEVKTKINFNIMSEGMIEDFMNEFYDEYYYFEGLTNDFDDENYFNDY